MASKGNQKTNITNHLDKYKVANRYKELKDIIIQNSNVPFKDIIYKIAQINVGTFYNYIYAGNQMGQVSLFTIENLSKYFELPQEVFTSEAQLTPDIKSTIISKISKDFNSNVKCESENVLINKCGIEATFDILDSIKNISVNLNNENSIETLQQAIKLIEISLSISNNRLNNLIQLNKF